MSQVSVICTKHRDR